MRGAKRKRNFVKNLSFVRDKWLAPRSSERTRNPSNLVHRLSAEGRSDHDDETVLVTPATPCALDDFSPVDAPFNETGAQRARANQNVRLARLPSSRELALAGRLRSRLIVLKTAFR